MYIWYKATYYWRNCGSKVGGEVLGVVSYKIKTFSLKTLKLEISVHIILHINSERHCISRYEYYSQYRNEKQTRRFYRFQVWEIRNMPCILFQCGVRLWSTWNIRSRVGASKSRRSLDCIHCARTSEMSLLTFIPNALAYVFISLLVCIICFIVIYVSHKLYLVINDKFSVVPVGQSQIAFRKKMHSGKLWLEVSVAVPHCWWHWLKTVTLLVQR